jgi:hypothetical protein
MTSTLQALRIVYGTRIPVGDTSTDWMQQDVVDLLSINNFSVNAQGWIPKVAALKGGGNFLDSGVSDGKELTATAFDLVKETLVLTSTGANPQSRYAAESKLHKMNARAIAYHAQTEGIQPVYLEWWAYGAPAPQYALIYTIEVAYSANAFEAVNVDEIALVITRAPLWRGIPPRVPAQAYALERVGSELTASNADLASYTTTIALTTLANKMEVAAGAYLTRNYIKIPAALIPGDAPALVQVTIGADTTNVSYPFSAHRLTSLYISKSTRLRDLEINSGTFARLPKFHLNMGEAALIISGAVVATGADYGVICSGTHKAWEYSVPTTGVYLSTPNVEYLTYITPSMYGRFAVFLRSTFLTTGTPHVTCKLEVANNDYNGADPLNMLSPKRLIGENRVGQLQGIQNRPDLTYMGVVQLPFPGKDSFDGNARHAGVSSNDQQYNFRLSFKNTSGAARTIQVMDLILMPIDEGMVSIEFAPLAVSGIDQGSEVIIYDETGHLNAYGYPQAVAARQNAPGPAKIGASAPIVRGGPISLTPGVDNYLFFLWTEDKSGQVEPLCPYPNAFEPVAVQIVPQWMGMRDRL